MSCLPPRTSCPGGTYSHLVSYFLFRSWMTASKENGFVFSGVANFQRRQTAMGIAWNCLLGALPFTRHTLRPKLTQEGAPSCSPPTFEPLAQVTALHGQKSSKPLLFFVQRSLPFHCGLISRILTPQKLIRPQRKRGVIHASDTEPPPPKDPKKTPPNVAWATTRYYVIPSASGGAKVLCPAQYWSNSSTATGIARKANERHPSCLAHAASGWGSRFIQNDACQGCFKFNLPCEKLVMPRSVGGRGGGRPYSVVACLSPFTIYHASLSRRSTPSYL